MAVVGKRRGWEIPERLATPEEVYLNRRRFMAMLGAGTISAFCAGGALAAGATEGSSLYPAARNARYTLDRPITDEKIASNYINFYEFTTDKTRVSQLARRFKPKPWTIQVGGLVKKEKRFDFDDLLKKVTLEERLYRFRCVEAWSMAVPWTGFPMKDFIDLCEPLGHAKFIRFITVHRPAEMPGIRSQPWYPWPYFEGLSMAEATNELTLMVTGIYGHELPNQHGAPIRAIVPWKYGYKSPKSIARVEFVEKQPETFWNKLHPVEYGFESNVNPKVPHPRWSQATEKFIKPGPGGSLAWDVMETLPYNGYGEHVAHLYSM